MTEYFHFFVFQIQELFEETTQELAVTSEHLDRTKVNLKETKVQLIHTQVDRDAHQQLATELTKTQDELYNTANCVSVHILAILCYIVIFLNILNVKVSRK